MKFFKIILRRAFSLPSGVPGRLGGMIMARRNRRMARQAIALLDIQPNDRVLEVGFGPGVAIQLVADATPAQWIAGIDPSHQMLEQASARNATEIATGRVVLWQEPVAGLSRDDALFDRVVAIRSMQLWPDAAAGLREIRRVLRPGGRIVLGFTRHCDQTKEDVSELLTMAGFADTRLVEAGGDFFVIAIKPDANYE